MNTLANIKTENDTLVSTLRFKVTVSQAQPELYKLLSNERPYYRSRRFVQLANLGLMLEQGRLTNACTSPYNAAQTPVIEEIKSYPTHSAQDVSQKLPITENLIRYNSVSEEAGNAIADLLGSLDINGFGA